MKKIKRSGVTTLDSSDVATILAALRMFQEAYEDEDAEAMRTDWPNHFEGIEPLGTSDINTLCENINTSQSLVIR